MNKSVLHPLNKQSFRAYKHVIPNCRLWSKDERNIKGKKKSKLLEGRVAGAHARVGVDVNVDIDVDVYRFLEQHVRKSTT